VLTAIGLDDETMPGAGEIDDEATDRMLPAEFIALQSPTSQRRPETTFRIGGVLAKVRGSISHRGAGEPSPASLRSAPSPAMRARG
jgi:hypothetical protein